MEMLDRQEKGGRVARFLRVAVGTGTKWFVVAAATLLSAVALALGGSAAVSGDPASALPDSADSTQAAELQAQLPGSEIAPAIVVFSRTDGPLGAADRDAIEARSRALASFAIQGRVGPVVLAEDARAAVVSVPLATTLDNDALREAVTGIRTAAREGLPAGLRAEVTGSPAFDVDLAAVFEGADVTLLGATVLVVALLLLITYRSPWLWLVPLVVVVVGDQVAAKVVAVLTRISDLQVDDSTLGITSVLVFGAGTNYALLLIARYREELRRVEDRHEAMRRALASAGPAILASSGTVFGALLTLSFAVTPSIRSVGLAGAAGIAVAVAYALVVLPAALLLFGRRLFWPFVPRVGQPDPTRSGPWQRIGAAVVRRPRSVALASVAVLGVLALGGTGLQTGLALTEQFRERVEATEGLETLSRSFPAGAADPAVILVDAPAAAPVAIAARSVPGVASARVGESDVDLAQVDVVLEPPPGTDASFTAIRALRERVVEVAGAQDALVGGTEAADLDAREAAARDRAVVIPIVLAVVTGVLLVLLRSVVAAGLLLATVVASFAASIGAGWLLFANVFDFPALDTGVPLLAFIFLVALGIDYNIFLTTRAREEAARTDTRSGIVTALAVTGGVITSAGVLLAAVFAVLGVLPLITLTQLGVIVGVGVLLDTLLVRSVLVPALVAMTGRRFWWPSALSRVPAGEPAVATAVAPVPAAERAGG